MVWSIVTSAVLAAVVPALAGSALPPTPLTLLDGSRLDLQSLQGNVVVLRFLASW